MFNTRSNDWIYHSIPASSWKYTEPDYWTPPKNYANYPERMVTHPITEPFIRCHQCLVEFSTDSKRLNTKGEHIYVPIHHYVSFRRGSNAYFCNVPCIDPRVEEEKKKKQAALDALHLKK